MNFNFSIENLGNIKKANFEIKPLTIIAGENGSGKSFTTKSLYCLLDALNKDYLFDYIQSNINGIKRAIFFYESELLNKSKKDINFIENFQEKYLNFFDFIQDELQKLNLEQQEKMLQNFSLELKQHYKQLKEYFEEQSSLKKFQRVSEHTDNILTSYSNIIQFESNFKYIISEQIEKNLKSNFQKNFQISNIETLIQKDEKVKSIDLKIDSIGNVLIKDKQYIDFSFKSKGIVQIQNLKNIVYIDSPAYLKVRKGLESRYRGLLGIKIEDEKYLKGYPLYLERLYDFLDKRYLYEPDFKNLSEELQKLMNGKLNITKSGEIEYLDEKNNSMPLSLTAMGITNIGLIDLLLRNNIINKGSFLIMDEPEAHLHPKWQVALIDILYKVAQAGANIIIATHSIDMIKAVELLIKKDEKAKDLIAINKMPYNESFSKLKEEEKIEEILSDLSSPFYDMYIRGLS
ncbi:AAA family ATPase [Aliarcobacter lanthieri]|uniref:AAA family ATPase n=1 Tax=Aliarcobacter lanthieri TaxID=1355374 RepID=UPI000478F7BD|nr:AAA family ATPase [Aliarcobacter lanthieri]QKF58958.1 ATP-binding protein (AAA domain) [Aliarcobacter lanthieri]